MRNFKKSHLSTRLCYKMLAFFFLLSMSVLSYAQIADGCYSIKNVEDNKYLSHNGGGSIEYYANRGTADGWEKFYITNVENGKVTIYGEDGKYLSAQQAGLVWKAGAPQDWEKWHYDSNLKTFTSHHDTQMYPSSIDVIRTANYLKENPEAFISGAPNPYPLYFQWIIEPSQGCKTP